MWYFEELWDCLYHFTFPPAMYMVPVSPHPYQHLLLSVFFIIIVILFDYRVWSCSSLWFGLHFPMVNDAEHLFLCFVGHVNISFGKMSIQILSHFSLSCLSFNYWIVSVLNIFLIHVLIKHDLQNFLPFWSLFSLSSWWLLKHKNFNVDDVQFIIYIVTYAGDIIF